MRRRWRTVGTATASAATTAAAGNESHRGQQHQAEASRNPGAPRSQFSPQKVKRKQKNRQPPPRRPFDENKNGSHLAAPRLVDFIFGSSGRSQSEVFHGPRSSNIEYIIFYYKQHNIRTGPEYSDKSGDNLLAFVLAFYNRHRLE
jgi:hypothetical protein